MGSHQANVKMTIVIFALLFTVVMADQDTDHASCPSAEVTSGMKVNSFISVGGIMDEYPLCGMEYEIFAGVTLYQGMLAAEQQHGSNFTFTTSDPPHPMWGHFIESINEVPSNNPFYWLVFDNATQMTTPVGVDFIDIVSGSSYLWQYLNTSAGHNSNYTGPCVGSSFIPPTMPLSYSVAYLTISSENTVDATNGTFKPVCKRPVLIQSTGTTVFTLLQNANDQLPIYVKAVLNMQNKTVTSINGVANSNSNTWTGYDAATNMVIPYDLTLTTVTDGYHIVFRFIKDSSVGSDPDNGAPSAGGQVSILLSAMMVLATAIMSM